MFYSLRRLFSASFRAAETERHTPKAGAPVLTHHVTSPAAAAAATHLAASSSLLEPHVPASPDNVLDRIMDAIEEIRPAIRMDGGDIELVGLEGDTVIVRLKGACRSCPMSAMTLQLGVECLIFEMAPEIKHVRSV